MMRWLAVFLFLSPLLPAADRWAGFRSGPFEVLTDAGERAGRDRLADLEQFRAGVEQVLGRTDLQPVWPIRILVFRSAKQALPVLDLARDAYVGALPAEGPMPRAVLRACASILIQTGPRGLSPDMENGLADVFSTLQVDGSRITLGAPPPPAECNLNWARMHMLTVSPGYYGRMPVLVHNLEQGVEQEPATRNAFEKSPAEIEKAAEAYLRAGQFETAPLRSRTLRPEKDFAAMPLAPGAERVAQADLLLADPARGAAAQSAYQAILTSVPGSPEALEGLGLLALRENRTGEARSLLGQAVAASGAGARALYEYARLESDGDKALAALERAAKLNPRWGLPPFEMAQREKNPARRSSLLASAAKLEPREVVCWRALAEAQEAEGQFIDAAKSWASAEAAAASPEERQRIRQIRIEAEARRRQQEAEAKQREADEKLRELEKLKQQGMTSIQAALEKAQREHPAIPPASGKVEPWQDGPHPDAKVEGLLQQVDCLAKQARLAIAGKDGKVVRLLVRDPNQIAFVGAKETTLTCGPQRPPRNVIIEYFAKPDPSFGTAGDAAVIEFP